jgi:hypothetical protein
MLSSAMLHYFISFSPDQIVPLDSTMNEKYVLRCLHRAIIHRDASYLTSALDSLSVAIQMNLQKEVNTDTLLDCLIPILHSKCQQTGLHNALQKVSVHLDGDANGATGFSKCIFESATLARINIV